LFTVCIQSVIKGGDLIKGDDADREKLRQSIFIPLIQKYCQQIYHYMSIVSSLRGKIGIHFSYLDLSANLSNSKNHRFLTEF
jgi:hypothetical protein